MRRPYCLFLFLAVIAALPFAAGARAQSSGATVKLSVLNFKCIGTNFNCPPGDNSIRVGDGLAILANYTFPVTPDPDNTFSAEFIFTGDLGTIGNAPGGIPASEFNTGCMAASSLRFIFFDVPSLLNTYSTAGLKVVNVEARRCRIIDFYKGSPIFTPTSDLLAMDSISINVANEVGGTAPLQYKIEATDVTRPQPRQPFEIFGIPLNAGGTPTLQSQSLLGQLTSWSYMFVDPLTGSTGYVNTLIKIESQTPNQLGNLSNIFREPTRLFPNNVLIPFNAFVQFTAITIHSGTAILLFQPHDLQFPNAPAVRVQVVVSSCSKLGPPPPPAAPQAVTNASGPTTFVVSKPPPVNVRLGTQHNEFDDDIICFADFRGIPPQLVKAHIDREARVIPSTGEYDPKSFRYEPLSLDFSFVSFGKDLRTDPRFAPYRLQTFPDFTDHAALSQGADLLAADIQPRQKYFVQLDSDNPNNPPLARVVSASDSPLSRRLNSNDSLITMENIFWTNDKQHARENWSTVIGGRKRKKRLEDYQAARKSPFVAQTVIASSYGLMQMTYPTAVDRFKYIDGNGIGLPPHLLFDVDTSIDVGTQDVSKAFKKRFPKSASKPDYSFQFFSLWDEFGVALSAYNGNARYPAQVLSRVAMFPPIKQ